MKINAMSLLINRCLRFWGDGLSPKFKRKLQKDVVSTPGEPKPTNYFSIYQLVYWLGPERRIISIDSECLVFSINDQNVMEIY